MPRAKPKLLLRIALLLAPLSFALGACETLENLNPFDEQKKPLVGDRRTLFPEGVPGIVKNEPPTQPTNSNIQVTPDTQNPAPQTQTQETPQPPARRGPAQKNSEDPWTGARR
jgi:hypothetical protein